MALGLQWLFPTCVLSHIPRTRWQAKSSPSYSSLLGSHQAGGPGHVLLRMWELSLSLPVHACCPLWVRLLLLLYTALEKLLYAQQDWPRAGGWLSSKAPGHCPVFVESAYIPTWEVCWEHLGICYSLGNSVSLVSSWVWNQPQFSDLAYY